MNKKKRRVIICGWFFYPRGGALSNYVQYLGKALQRENYEVEIWSSLNYEYPLVDGGKYDDFLVYDIQPHNPFSLLRRLMDGKMYHVYFTHRLRHFHLSKNDVVIISPSFKGIDVLMQEKRKIGFKTIGIPLEWFGREQYDNEKAAYRGELCFRRNIEHDLLFPISHYIREQFPEIPCLVLPCMIDTEDVSVHAKKMGKYSFIYPANGMMKDALQEMLLGLGSLTEEELKRIEFHLLGITQEKLDSMLSDTMRKKLSYVLIRHDWMKYSELSNLYSNIHFLFLARKTNQMTCSNFPSKVPEAMTYGVVPVVSRVGDYTKYYLRDEENSLIFDGYDASVCAKAIRRALALSYTEYGYLSRGARKSAEDLFDYRRWSKSIYNCIENLF